MQTLSADQFKKKFGEAGISQFTQTSQTKTNPTSLKDKAGSFLTGIGKGALESAIGTADLLQKGGRHIQAAIDPVNNYSDLTNNASRDAEQGPAWAASLDGKNKQRIDEDLKSENPYETGGKATEFVASMFFPVGKTKEVGMIANKGKELASTGFNASKEGASQLKSKVVDAMSSLDEKTKTALARTPKEVFSDFVERGRRAMYDDRNRSPLESVGDDIIDGLKQIKERASSIGGQKSDYINRAKVGLKRTGNLVDQAILDTRKIFQGMKMDTSDNKAVANFYTELKKLGRNPTLVEVDKTIDLIQDSLYKSSRNSAVEVTDRVTGPLRNILGKLNAASQEIGGPAYKKYNKEYGDLMEIVNELNARVGKEGGGAGSFVKRLFSPSDARTKHLFEQLQKYTGKDYFRDARLAKFVMDVLGDSRAKSLLEEIPTSAGGAISKVIDYGKKKLSDPLKAAERFIDKNN